MIAVSGPQGGNNLGNSTHSKLVLRAFRAEVGAEGMRDLYAAKGGIEIYVPRECDADHWMSRLFGLKKANAICARLNVTDADGRVVGNLSAYVPAENSRILALRAQIEEEIKQALIAGRLVHDVVREVGTSERSVRRELRLLREAGVIPHSRISRVRPQRQSSAPNATDFGQKRAQMRERVDEMLLAGKMNRKIVLETGAGLTFVRHRRSVLAAAGKLGFAAETVGGDFNGVLPMPSRKSARLEQS